MTRRRKLTDEDCEKIAKLIDEGHLIKDLAEKYGVDRSTISNRCKAMYKSRKIPVEIKNKVIKAIKEGYTKAEAAQLYELNIGTVVNFTKNIQGHSRQGNHILRQNGIKLLNRLMTDGYLMSDFVVPTARNLQRRFPVIMSARYRCKTFFYLKGREQETIEAYFRDRPDRIINYHAVEEISYLLGVQISKKDQSNLMEKYKGKHKSYWESHRLIQRCLDDWSDEPQSSEISFRLFPKQGEW